MLKKNILLIILITFTIKSFSQREFKTEVFEQAINNLDEFIEFLSYPNDANYESDIYKLMDWTEDKFSSSFTFSNPNETARCGCGESFTVS